MNWKYYIPHVWDSPESRTAWEDVYLRLDEANTDGESYWFTLNAVTFGAAGVEGNYPEDPADPFGPGTFNLVREMNLRLLGDREYFITPVLDMVARVDDFNLSELLEWTRVFIKDHFGDPNPILVQGEFADFRGTNNHAAEIGRISEALAAGVPEEEVVFYHPTPDCDESKAD